MNVVDPRSTEPRDWMDVTSRLLAPFSVSVLKVDRGDQWREWGTHVRQALIRRGIVTPIPDQYDDWREWAVRFNQIVQVL